jgi:hypothetical protein
MKSHTEAAPASCTSATLDAARRHQGTREHRQPQVDLLTHGGIGYIQESGVPQFLRDPRIAHIVGGAKGIRLWISSICKVAGDNGKAVRRVNRCHRSGGRRPGG